MLNTKEIIDYGSCYITSTVTVYPADEIDLPRKVTLFDVCQNGTHETLDTFRTAGQAKKFAHRYIANPIGTIQRQRMLSGDRLTHIRALRAISLLSNWMEYDLIIADNRNPKVKPEQYEASNIFVTAAEN